MLVREMIKLGESRLTKAHCMDPWLDAELIYYHITGADRVELFLRGREPVDEETQKRYFDLIARREQRIPLQHITGTQEFMGLNFQVNPNVLIPRQDTEILVEEAAKIIRGDNSKTHRRKAWKVLDLCCGSGAIGIALSRICENVKVTASDCSEPALETAKQNAKKNRVKLRFRQGDLYKAVGKRRYDLIASNPPYIRSHMIPILQDEVKLHEPMIALDGGEDGLDFYRSVTTLWREALRTGGMLFFEVGIGQADDVLRLMRSVGFGDLEITTDPAGIPRVVYGRLYDEI